MNKIKEQALKIGSTFGNYIIIENCHGKAKIKCVCKLTNTVVTVSRERLIQQTKQNTSRTLARIPNVGEKSRLLTVIDNKTRRGKHGEILIKVQCDCSKKKYVRNLDFINRNISSCGCTRKEKIRQANTKHGLYQSKEYKTWQRIKTICLNENNPAFKRYGGSGIEIYSRWVDSFEAFYEDMGPCPKNSLLARIDPSKGFLPNNCCWLSRREHRRINILIKCGVNPQLLIQPRTKPSSHSLVTVSRSMITSIRKEHGSGEANISVLAQKYGISQNEVISILINE